MTRSPLGAWGEAAARQYLEGNGYRVRACNWRCAEGEIDLVAETEGTLVFVEVKTRRGADFGTPQDAVGPRKAKNLLLAASRYLEEQKLDDVDWRVDVIAITAEPGPRVLNLEHITDAVEDRVP
ncbi:MAG: YraN family protein [Chloroflexi bacterium]|nr:YraN family protein [Chloroflexota bacterium]